MPDAFRFQTVPTLVVEFGAARRLGALLRERYPRVGRDSLKIRRIPA
jgi:alcohol dehydrogenase